MGDENLWPDFVEKRRYGRCDHINIEWACAWGHRAKLLVQIGCGKFVAKLFVRVLENATIRGLHGSEILG
jgi:hypothetical protein